MRALALYEPTLFAWLDAEAPPPNPGDGIRDAVARSAAALDAGDRSDAAEHFIDYWMGAGTWVHLPEKRQAPIAASVVNARRWAHALFTEPTPLAAFRELRIPTLCMVGGRSTASARGVARLLCATLPQVEVVEFADCGHMGPITHPDEVNESIVRFLARA